MLTLTTTDGTRTWDDDTAERIIGTAVYRADFVGATMHGYTLQIVDEAHATLTSPGIPGLVEPTVEQLTAADARHGFLSAVID